MWGANVMKSTNQFLHNFRQHINGLFSAGALSQRFSKPKRVWLIIEDDPSVLHMLGELVQFWGRKPIVLQDGCQAMRWVEDFRAGRYEGPIPELTLSDVKIPGPEGHEVCGELRKIPELSDMPIIMRSAWRFTTEERQSVMQTSQADRLITYPYPKLDEFKAIIDEVLESRQQVKVQ